MSLGKWKRLTEVESAEIAQRYSEGETMEALMREYACGTGQLYKALRVNRVVPRSRRETRTRYSKNERAFDAPLTAEALYWLGFLATDGCVVTNLGAGGGQDQIALKLAVIDKDHVQAFRAFLGSDAPLLESANVRQGVRYPWVMLRVSSQVLCDRLVELGVTKQKTFTLRVSEELAESPDFWRGALDGDGTIRWNTGKQVYAQLVGASLPFIEQFAAFCGTIGVRLNPLSRTGATWKACATGRDNVQKLTQVTYGRSGPVLARKCAELTYIF